MKFFRLFVNLFLQKCAVIFFYCKTRPPQNPEGVSFLLYSDTQKTHPEGKRTVQVVLSSSSTASGPPSPILGKAKKAPPKPGELSLFC